MWIPRLLPIFKTDRLLALSKVHGWELPVRVARQRGAAMTDCIFSTEWQYDARRTKYTGGARSSSSSNLGVDTAAAE